MAGTRTSAIRADIAAILRGGGWAPSAYAFRSIGSDKGSRVHRSFATSAARVTYEGRQGGADVMAPATIVVRAVVSTQQERGPAADDAVEDLAGDLVSLLLLSSLQLEVRDRVITPLQGNDRTYLVTVSTVARYQAYTQDPPL